MEQRTVGLVVLCAVSVFSCPSGQDCWGLLLRLLSRVILLGYCIEQRLGPEDIHPAPSGLVLPAGVASVAEAKRLLSSLQPLHRDHCLGLSPFLKGPCSWVYAEHQGLESWISAIIICGFSSPCLSPCCLRIAIRKGEISKVLGACLWATRRNKCRIMIL